MISILADGASGPSRSPAWCCSTRRCPGPRRALDPLVAADLRVYAVPGVGERFLRCAATRHDRRWPGCGETLALCGVDPDALPPEVIDRSVALLEQREDVDGHGQAFLAAARSLLRAARRPAALPARRWPRSASPVLLVHGDRDRLVPVAAARDIARRHPSWRYLELAGVGHVPQLQVPERLAEDVLAWLDDTADDRAALGRSRRVSRSASSPV